MSNGIADVPPLSTNIRAVSNKIDELQQVALLNNTDALAWLSDVVDDSYVSIQGFNLFRRDRPNSNRGGVCLHLSSSFPCQRLPVVYCVMSRDIW